MLCVAKPGAHVIDFLSLRRTQARSILRSAHCGTHRSKDVIATRYAASFHLLFLRPSDRVLYSRAKVTAAAKAVIDEYKRTHPELDEKDLAVDLPPPPPAAGPSHPGVREHAHLHHPIPGFGFDLGAVGAGRLEFGAHGHAHGNMVALAEFVQAHPAPPQAAHARNARRAAERERRVDLVRMWQRQAQQAREELDVAQREAAHVLRRAAAHPPVQNVHVHIHHNQAPAPAPGPAHAPAPVLPQQLLFPPAHFPAPPAAPVHAPPRAAPYVQVPGHARAPAPAARAPVAQRRSRRVQGRRAHLD